MPETDCDYDTVSDCDADVDIDDLYAAATNIIAHVLEGSSLGPEFRALVAGYHERHACHCTDLVSVDADSYHLKLVIAVLELYYGPDYTFLFVPTLPHGEEPTRAQMAAMLPDERVPYQVQFRLVQEGIMDQLPRLQHII